MSDINLDKLTERSNVVYSQARSAEQFCKDIDVINRNEFESRIMKRKEAGEPVRLVVFGCMPELIPSVYDNRYIRYDFAGSGLKSTVDYKTERFGELSDEIVSNYGVSVEMTCLIADTEARVKSDGLLRPVSKEELRVKALKVSKRVAKNFPGEVLLRSDVFPVASKIYRENFLKAFREIVQEEVSTWFYNGPDNPRINLRISQLSALGADLEVAVTRSLRDMALMDAEYAMEGLWLTTESDFDALIVADNYPLSYYQRTFRLLTDNKLPVIFLGPYEEFKGF